MKEKTAHTLGNIIIISYNVPSYMYIDLHLNDIFNIIYSKSVETKQWRKERREETVAGIS